MAQESIFNKSIAIIGGGPAGCICAKLLSDEGFDVTIFEKGNPLRTILPTGGGRCNLAHSEFDFRELAKNYPRGEKFLYSIFSRFSTQQTLEFFDSIGIKTYTQEDNRIFPTSNSSSEVRKKFLNSMTKVNFVKDEVLNLEKLNNCFKIKTQKSSYAYDIVVIAIGGHANFNIVKNLDLKIIKPTQALVGLVTKEDFESISGVALKNVKIKSLKNQQNGDILFTHKGISGPLVYKISSLKAREEVPYKLTFQLANCDNLQELLNANPHKTIKNLLSQIIPKSLASWILDTLEIKEETTCHQINGRIRDKIINKIQNFETTIIGKVPDGEVVTCGGIDLKEVNPKTLEAKNYKNLYFCGEVLDIDGFCGGFNLQNCWSTGFVCAEAIKESHNE